MNNAQNGVARRDLLVATALAGAAVGSLLLFGTSQGDAPAHLYRTFLVQHGAVLWDNLWYAGQYPLTSYSLLYYFPAATVGNVTLVVGAVLASALLFAAIAHQEWGAAARWPTRWFSVLAAAPVFTGLYTYTLGLATLLAALRVLQRGRAFVALLLAGITLGVSPLAFVFLCAILLAVFLSRRRIDRRTIIVAAGLALIACGEGIVLVLFPTPGTYPFSPIDLAAILTICALGAYLATRSDRSGVLAAFFVVWGLGSVATFLVPTAVGDNWTRPRAFVFPLMLLTAAQARFRPRPLVVVALVGALAYNLVPYLMQIPYRLDSRPASAGFWRPALAYLARHDGPDYRVEVVPTANHWEAYWLPRAGFALARGWYRQLDIEQNPVLYEKHLTTTAYRSWLRTMAIRYVLLPATQLDPDGGPREAAIVSGPRSGLRLVFRDTDWRIYALPHPTAILTGKPGAHLDQLGHEAVTGTSTAAGAYALRIRFTPYWTVTPAGTCVRPAPGGMTELVLARPGRFTLRAPRSLDGFLDTLSRNGSSRCRPLLRTRAP